MHILQHPLCLSSISVENETALRVVDIYSLNKERVNVAARKQSSIDLPSAYIKSLLSVHAIESSCVYSSSRLTCGSLSLTLSEKSNVCGMLVCCKVEGTISDSESKACIEVMSTTQIPFNWPNLRIVHVYRTVVNLPSERRGRNFGGGGEQDNNCVVCLGRSVSLFTSSSCGHRLFCQGCAKTNIFDSINARCPICRKATTQLFAMR